LPDWPFWNWLGLEGEGAISAGILDLVCLRNEGFISYSEKLVKA
jgi:hypothetical protein